MNELSHSGQYDKITVHVRRLAALYRFMIMSLMICVACELTDEQWKINELLGVIRKEIEACESSEGTKIKPQPFNSKSHTHGHNPPISSAL